MVFSRNDARTSKLGKKKKRHISPLLHVQTQKINADSKASIICFDTLSTRSLNPKCIHAFKTDRKQKKNLMKNGSRCEQVFHKRECQQS